MKTVNIPTQNLIRPETGRYPTTRSQVTAELLGADIFLWSSIRTSSRVFKTLTVCPDFFYPSIRQNANARQWPSYRREIYVG